MVEINISITLNDTKYALSYEEGKTLYEELHEFYALHKIQNVIDSSSNQKEENNKEKEFTLSASGEEVVRTTNDTEEDNDNSKLNIIDYAEPDEEYTIDSGFQNRLIEEMNTCENEVSSELEKLQARKAKMDEIIKSFDK